MSRHPGPASWSVKRPSHVLLLLVLATGLLSACATASDAQTREVVVADIDGEDSAAGPMTREELDDHIRRFADRYYTRMGLAIDRIRTYPLTPREANVMQAWQALSQATAVDIAIGPNPVTNLLDMMVLTALGRMVIEDFWVPQGLGEERGEPLLAAAVILEEDIWTIADDVLTPEQKNDLMFLVTEWHENNPDQIYPWLIRMSEFSGQRAAALQAVKQSGGLLKEVARARETAEELQAFGERVLFYLQRAPSITSNTMETSVMQLLGGPEVSNLLRNTDQFVESVERLVQVIEELPEGRLAAVDQLIEGLGQERRSFFDDLAASDDELRPMLQDLHNILQIVERIVVTMESGEGSSEPVDIAEYRALTAEATATAVELRNLVDSIGRVIDDSPAVISVIDELITREEEIVNRWIILLMVLIAFFFVCLLAYRYVAARLLPT